EEARDLADQPGPGRLAGQHHVIVAFERHEFGARNRARDQAALFERSHVVVAAVQHERGTCTFGNSSTTSISSQALRIRTAFCGEGVMGCRLTSHLICCGEPLGKNTEVKTFMKAECSSPQPCRMMARNACAISASAADPRLLRPCA